MIAPGIAMLAVVAELVRVVVSRKWSDLNMVIGLAVMIGALFAPSPTRTVLMFDVLQRLRGRTGNEG